MTTTIITATVAALVLAPGTLTTAPKAKTSPTAVKLNPKAAAQVKGAQPKFKPLLSKPSLIKGAKDRKIVPADDEPPLTTLATLSPANPREGAYAVDFKCATVLSSLGADGMAFFPFYQAVWCRDRSDVYHAGVEVVFAAEAGRAYAVECAGNSSPDWRIRHKIGTGAWSPAATVDTANPVDYVIATSSGEARVQFELVETDNHVSQHGVQTCRISRIG